MVDGRERLYELEHAIEVIFELYICRWGKTICHDFVAITEATIASHEDIHINVYLYIYIHIHLFTRVSYLQKIARLCGVKG